MPLGLAWRTQPSQRAASSDIRLVEPARLGDVHTARVRASCTVPEAACNCRLRPAIERVSEFGSKRLSRRELDYNARHDAHAAPPHLPHLDSLAVAVGRHRHRGHRALVALGNSVDAILRENYVSVIAMERLNEALERIDSSYQFALSGRRDQARQQYQETGAPISTTCKSKRNNITLPGERELYDQLERLTAAYKKQGDAFYAIPSGDPRAQQAYYGPAGLLDLFKQIKDVSGAILHLNQENMEHASRDARRLARISSIGFAIALAAAFVLAGFAAWQTVRIILRPIQAMTHAALGISAGNLHQIVPYHSRDELGQLAEAFNTMTRHLRDVRQSQSARLLRVQQTTQATVDSFPDPVIVIDSEGYVEMANPAARRLLGVLPKQHGQPTSGTLAAARALAAAAGRRTAGAARLFARRIRPGHPAGFQRPRAGRVAADPFDSRPVRQHARGRRRACRT